jgi:hypothetical protein
MKPSRQMPRPVSARWRGAGRVEDRRTRPLQSSSDRPRPAAPRLRIPARGAPRAARRGAAPTDPATASERGGRATVLHRASPRPAGSPGGARRAASPKRTSTASSGDGIPAWLRAASPNSRSFLADVGCGSAKNVARESLQRAGRPPDHERLGTRVTGKRPRSLTIDRSRSVCWHRGGPRSRAPVPWRRCGGTIRLERHRAGRGSIRA